MERGPRNRKALAPELARILRNDRTAHCVLLYYSVSLGKCASAHFLAVVAGALQEGATKVEDGLWGRTTPYFVVRTPYGVLQRIRTRHRDCPKKQESTVKVESKKWTLVLGRFETLGMLGQAPEIINHLASCLP